MSPLDLRCRHAYPTGFTLDVAFESQGTVTALFGPSGSGKSSLLSIVSGLLRPRQGRVRLGDRLLFDSAGGVDLPPNKRRVGHVFQDHLLFPHLKVRRNLRYGLARNSAGKAAISFDRVVEVLELGPLLDRWPRNLSGGERQRVALGRLLSQPQLLLLDEPWSALDEALKHRVLAYLERALREWSLPTLLVSHDQSAVRRLADWVVVLDQGRVVNTGKPAEALGQPVPLAWKDASRPVNLLRLEEARQQGGHWHGRVGAHWLRLPPAANNTSPPAFVEFLPGDVALARQDVAGLSMRNHLPGTVRQIVSLPDATFVAIDVGQDVWAEITPEALTELALAPGQPVTCLIKTHSLRVLQQVGRAEGGAVEILHSLPAWRRLDCMATCRRCQNPIDLAGASSGSVTCRACGQVIAVSRRVAPPAAIPTVLPAAAPVSAPSLPTVRTSASQVARRRGGTLDIFDVGFRKLIAPQIIKVLYVLALVVNAVWFLAACGSAVSIAITALRYDMPRSAIGIGVAALIVVIALLVTLLSVLLSRVLLEVSLVLFRVEEHLDEMRHRGP